MVNKSVLARSIATLTQTMPKVALNGVAATKPTAPVMKRPEWQVARNKAGGKAGMVKGVDIGKLLDAWHAAMSRDASFTVASRNVDKQTHALIMGLNKYKADPTVAKTLGLREIVEAQLKAVDAHVARAGQANRAASTLGKQLAELKTITTTKPLSFPKMATHIRLVGTAIRNLSDSDPSVMEISSWWNSGVAARHSVGGVAAGKSDPPAYQAEAAAALTRLVDKVRDELVKNKILA